MIKILFFGFEKIWIVIFCKKINHLNNNVNNSEKYISVVFMHLIVLYVY